MTLRLHKGQSQAVANRFTIPSAFAGAVLLVPEWPIGAFVTGRRVPPPLYVPQKERLEGARSKASPSGVVMQTSSRRSASTREPDPREGRKRFRGREEKLVSSDGVGDYSTGWSQPTGRDGLALFGPNHEIE